jgi:hypothetical protein
MNDKARRELEREASYLRFLLRVSDRANPDSPPVGTLWRGSSRT